MNDFGLDQQDIACICQTLAKFPEVEEALIFGSRAMNKHHKGSDIDIAIKGHNLQDNIITNIYSLLDNETPLPYKFDIINYHKINNASLIDHIERIGITFYRRNLSETI